MEIASYILGAPYGSVSVFEVLRCLHAPVTTRGGDMMPAANGVDQTAYAWVTAVGLRDQQAIHVVGDRS